MTCCPLARRLVAAAAPAFWLNGCWNCPTKRGPSAPLLPSGLASMTAPGSCMRPRPGAGWTAKLEPWLASSAPGTRPCCERGTLCRPLEGVGRKGQRETQGVTTREIERGCGCGARVSEGVSGESLRPCRFKGCRHQGRRYEAEILATGWRGRALGERGATIGFLLLAMSVRLADYERGTHKANNSKTTFALLLL